MTRTKFLDGSCQHCGAPIQFPAESAGATADCPHCRQPTELFLAVPRQPSTVPVKTIVFTLLAVLILVGGWVGAMLALKRAQRTVQRQQAAATASTSPASPALPPGFIEKTGFQISPISLERAADNSLVYAVGSIRNQTDRKRLGVRLELELLDAAGKAVGRASDFVSSVEPRAEWRFKALVVVSGASSARVSAIQEQP